MSKTKIIGIILLMIIAVLAFFTWEEHRKPTTEKQVVNAPKEVIERGQYLTKVGDCASCHTAQNGAMLAGNYEMKTPFGTLYSSNITPSADFGIGRWTSDDFYRAMTEGIAPPNRNLYPAMPYSYFNNITREDSDAIYAYLMSLPPIDIAPQKNKLPFPYNQRMILVGWNMLFLDPEELPSASKGNSAEWNRGKYIVNTLGHCAMCHTPMGAFGEPKADMVMQGGILGDFAAPNITPEGLAERGWTKPDLEQYFKTGLAPQGSTFSDMYLVMKNSTQYMTNEDISAITTYLMGDNPLPPKEITLLHNTNDNGRDLYLNMCAACHNENGMGKPNVSVAMIGNSTVRNPDSRNLIMTILEGLPWQTFPGYERLQAMPAFKDEMTNLEIADLVNYLRTSWAGLPGNITESDIQTLRK